jgi:hypothetical protein
LTTKGYIMQYWTDRKIRGLCNTLIAALKAAGIRATRQDISTWGQVVLKLGDSFVAGLDFRGEMIVCTANGFPRYYRPDQVAVLATDLIRRLREREDSGPVRLEKRSNGPRRPRRWWEPL